MKVPVIAFGLFLMGTTPLFAADTPQFDLAGSYAFMQDTSRSDSFPGGWAVAATGNVNSWIGVVAEVGGSHRSCDNCQRGPFATERFVEPTCTSRCSPSWGDRESPSHANSLVTPFAQVLVGGSHIRGGIEWDGALNTGIHVSAGRGRRRARRAECRGSTAG
jgi:hypothetical protein